MPTSSKIVPVILSGGAGQRLWPLSRQQFPKQFLGLNGHESMLQQTIQRVSDARFSPPLFICNDEHRFLVAEQARDIDCVPRAIVLEPVGRNTAPAAALAAVMVQMDDPDALILLLPSDHVIADVGAFLTALEIATAAADDGRLVTFGVEPDRAATGYGHIKKGEPLPYCGCFEIDRFTEKPDRETADRFLSEGGYYWNSGIFLFSARTYIETLRSLRPEILEPCENAVRDGKTDIDFFRPDAEHFSSCPSDSIDYAIMEHTKNGAMVPVNIGWNDLGSWDALWQIGERDQNNNVLTGDAIAHETSNSYLHSSGPLIASVGLDNVLLIATEDAVLAVSREHVEDVKTVVAALKERGRTEHLHHARVFRPWGWYQGLDLGEGFQVKHLMVKPGAGLSLQSHEHRAEHWVVVEGKAQVTRDDDVFILERNQSTYLPAGSVHRLENVGDGPLRVIEVQTGDYLGEDDITRYEDRYGRS